MSVIEKLAGFESEWNNESISIREVVRRLQEGVYPAGLVIFHKDYGTLQFNNIMPGVYLAFRIGPPISGRRGGVGRTFGNITMDAEWILPHIDDVFDNVSSDIDIQKRAAQKLLKLQTEGARKMMNQSSQNIPREIQNVVAQMIGERRPVPGAYNVPDRMAMIHTSLLNEEVNVPRHLKKINTTLFANGGKRKATRRLRRKSTRRRR